MKILLHGQLLDILHNVFGATATKNLRVKIMFRHLKEESRFPATFEHGMGEVRDGYVTDSGSDGGDDVQQKEEIKETFNIEVETSGKHFKVFII